MFRASLDFAGVVNGRLALSHFITFLGIVDWEHPKAVNKVKVSLLCFSFFPVCSPWTQPAFPSS